jgi:hydroxyethylthiazole kinase-like uncharacterized protein yjeF
VRVAHSVEQVRAAEAALMATLPPGTLMQRAAAGLAVACADYLGDVYGARVLIVAGSGDNGGDALWAGARLAGRGVQVHAVAVAASLHEQGAAALQAAGGRIVAEPDWGSYDLAIDGIVGIGGRPGLADRAATAVDALDCPVVAVDAPSGIGVDSAELRGPCVRADLTVTFGTHKIGLLADPAAEAAGVVELIDIGLGPYLGDPVVEVLQSDDVAGLLPVPAHGAHKYSRGVLGIAAGSEEYAGAGLLAASAAVQSGFAGMVRYEGASADLIRLRHPEVVIGSGQVQAWVVGPGLGDGQGSLVGRILAEGVATVVDADGLRYLPLQCTSPTVLTPHAGELARMLEADRGEVEAKMLSAATAAARRWRAVVLLKGPRSVIASPDGRVRINTTGVPWLATAGAGDVLSGVIGSLLAAGVEPFDAASAGAWLHGAAARLASAGGPITAGDVIAALPAVTAALLD